MAAVRVMAPAAADTINSKIHSLYTCAYVLIRSVCREWLWIILGLISVLLSSKIVTLLIPDLQSLQTKFGSL